MFEFLAFLTNKKYWKLHSFIIKFILCFFYKLEIGNSFYIEGVPKLKINGKPENIIFGNNVSVLGNIDLRNREDGKICFKDNVTIERDCRFVSAREGTIEIGEGSIITAYSILNGGSDIIIGKKCIIGPRSSINANEHIFTKNKPIREQGFIHEPVIIEDDCWLATNIVVNKGVKIAQGSVIASNSVIIYDTEEFSIYGGNPAKKIKERE